MNTARSIRRSKQLDSGRSKKQSPCRFEPLEPRQLLTTVIWSGAGSNTLFSNPANWVGNAVPTSGEDVQFPNYSATETVTIDGTPTVGSITFQGNYDVVPQSDASSNELAIGGGISVASDANVNITDGTSFNDNGVVTLNVGSDANLSLTQADGQNPFQIQQEGGGTVQVLGGDYSQMWSVMDGTLNVTGQTYMDVELNAGTLEGSGRIGGLDSSGTVDLTSNSSPATLDSAYNTRFYGGSVNFTLGNSQSSELTHQYNDITFEEPTTLGLTLAPGYTQVAGHVFTLFQNTSGSGISGTFSGLPEGTSIAVDGYNFSISYVGGTSGHDITLTALAATPTITLQPPAASFATQHAQTLTADVAGDFTSPTGTVSFYDNGQLIGSPAALHNGVATISVSYLAAGSHAYTATYSGDTLYASETSSSVSATVTASTPTVATPASATLKSDKSFLLSVLGADANGPGAGQLKYTWSVRKGPSGSSATAFATNGSLASRKDTVTFSRAGHYTLRCTITNEAGNTAISDVLVDVPQTATTLEIETASSHVEVGHSLQLDAVLLDQFHKPIALAAPIKYELLTGSGTISTAGKFKAGTKTGPVRILVKIGKLSKTLSLTVVS